MQEEPLILDRYRPISQQGAGASAVVEICWDTRIMRRVAIKRLALDNPMNAGEQTPGLAEARTAAMLSHPNIVSVIDFEMTQDEALLIMEAIEGPTLSDLIDQTGAGQFDCDIAAAVARAIGEALDFAHENQVLHLDIKPENILITPGGAIKVSDFGISELADAQGFKNASGGTIGYMPIEQMNGEDLDQRCDEFAYAATIYETLTGMCPFIAPTLEASKKLIDRFNVPVPSSINHQASSDVDEILLTALSPNRESRYETVFEFMDILVSALGDERAGTAKLKALLVSDDEVQPQASRQRQDLWERLSGRPASIAGRAASACMCWGAAAYVLNASFPLDPSLAGAAAAPLAVAALIRPTLGAFLSLAAIAASLGFGSTRSVPGALALLLVSIAWAFAMRTRRSAPANCIMSVLPFAMLGVAPLSPLLAGFCLTPLKAGITGTASALLLCGMCHFSSDLAFADIAPLFGVSELGGILSASPGTWALCIFWGLSAVLMSLLCSHRTRVSSILGIFIAAAVLAGAQVMAQWIATGLWEVPSTNWMLSLTASIITTVIVAALGLPIHTKGED